MASLDMQGPYVLVPDKIDEFVRKGVPGNFALGYVADADFIVIYIGRADNDLNAELKDWVFRKSNCLFFKFSYANSVEEAFKKECDNFHHFGGSTNLKNEEHPKRPDKTNWVCPHCMVYRG